MTRKSRIAAGVAAVLVCLAAVGFVTRDRIGAIFEKSVARDRPMEHALEEVVAAYGAIEKAMREGDGDAFLGLMAQPVLALMSDEAKQTCRADFTRRPGLRLDPVAVLVRDDQAFVIGKYREQPGMTAQSYLVRYQRENRAWKIAEQTLSDAPPYRPAIYAYLPVDGGAFAHADRPWRKIPYAQSGSAHTDDPAWKVQATRDETFLYVRYEAAVELPAAGDEISAADDRLAAAAEIPVARITVTTFGDKHALIKNSFEFRVTHNLGERGSPEGVGEGVGAPQVLHYAVVVKNDRGEVLFDGRSDGFNRLIVVRGRFIDVRLPLKSLGASTKTPPDIVISDTAAAPHFSPYGVERFSP